LSQGKQWRFPNTNRGPIQGGKKKVPANERKASRKRKKEGGLELAIIQFIKICNAFIFIAWVDYVRMKRTKPKVNRPSKKNTCFTPLFLPSLPPPPFPFLFCLFLPLFKNLPHIGKKLPPIYIVMSHGARNTFRTTL
jgi:hypothetical protein